MNACAGDSGIETVPYHYTAAGTGFQYSRSGQAYIFMAYINGLANSRNYFQVKLSDSLKAGKCYYGECFVNLSNPFKLACNNQAILLTRNPVYADTASPPKEIIMSTPQVVNFGNPIIKDTLNWIKVSGVFTAQGGEQYLTIGNFKDDINTAYQVVNPPGGYFGAAYYVDDVALYDLDSFPLHADAGRDTTIIKGTNAFIGTLTNGITNLTWYNSAGGIITNGAPGFTVSPQRARFTYLNRQCVAIPVEIRYM